MKITEITLIAIALISIIICVLVYLNASLWVYLVYGLIVISVVSELNKKDEDNE